MNIDIKLLTFGLTIRYMLTISIIDKINNESYKLLSEYFKKILKDFVTTYNKVFVTTKYLNRTFDFSLYYYVSMIETLDNRIFAERNLTIEDEYRLTNICKSIKEKIENIHATEKDNYNIITDIVVDPIMTTSVLRFGLPNELIDILELSINTIDFEQLTENYIKKISEIFGSNQKVVIETYLDSYNYSLEKNEDVKQKIKKFMQKEAKQDQNKINTFEIIKKLTTKLKAINIKQDDIANCIYKLVLYYNEDDIKEINNILHNNVKIQHLCQQLVKANQYNYQDLINLTFNTDIDNMIFYYGHAYKLNQRNTLSAIIDDTYENRSKILINPLSVKNNITKENDHIQLLEKPNIFCSIFANENIVKDIHNFVTKFNNDINIQELIVAFIKDISYIIEEGNKYDILQLISYIDFDGPVYESKFKYKFNNVLKILDDEQKILLFEDVVTLVLSYINFKSIKYKSNTWNILVDETEMILEALGKKEIKINCNIAGFINELFKYYVLDKNYYSPTVISAYNYFFDVRNKSYLETIKQLDDLTFEEIKIVVKNKIKQLLTH